MDEVQALQKERDQLLKRRNSVDEKLKNGRVLSPEVSNCVTRRGRCIICVKRALETFIILCLRLEHEF